MMKSWHKETKLLSNLFGYRGLPPDAPLLHVTSATNKQILSNHKLMGTF